MKALAMKAAVVATITLGITLQVSYASETKSDGFFGLRTLVEAKNLSAYPGLVQNLAPIVGRTIRYLRAPKTGDHVPGNMPTARGTVFFLGVYNNETLFATNAHVIPNDPINGCVLFEIRLVDKNGKSFKLGCTKIVASLTPEDDNSDVTIFSVGKAQRGLFDFYGPSKQALSTLEENRLQLDPTTTEPLKLLTAGHGAHTDFVYNKQWDYNLSYTTGCQPTHNALGLVQTNDAKAPIMTVANDCMTAKGDSGSPVVDLSTDKIVGIHAASSELLSYSYYLPFSDIMPKLRNKLPTIENKKMKQALNELLLEYGY